MLTSLGLVKIPQAVLVQLSIAAGARQPAWATHAQVLACQPARVRSSLEVRLATSASSLALQITRKPLGGDVTLHKLGGMLQM